MSIKVPEFLQLEIVEWEFILRGGYHLILKFIIFVKNKKMEIRLSIKDEHIDAFMALIKKLEYVEIKEISNPAQAAEEPIVAYNKNEKISAEEVEQLIIAKARRDAKAIERGELETYPFDSIEALIADLNNDEE